MALSAEQQQIVHCPVDRHSVVRAVAGSGKSHTMAERVAYLVEAQRVDPTHIIAVMFNKSASLEFSERLEKRLGKRNSPESVTYHRLGTLTLNRLMRAKLAPTWTFEANVSRARQFTVKVIKPYCDRNGLKYYNLVANSFLGFVDRIKSDLTSPFDVWAQGDWPASYDWFPECYSVYERQRAEAKMRFFSDLIYDAVTILNESIEARKVAANRYEHIIIDEYQDICEAQQALIRHVAGTKARVMVVGDEDQTIYAWRGAKPSYILHDFVKDFPGAIEFQLTRTWRYGHALSCAANYVITHNTERADKLCISGAAAPHTTLTLHFEEPKTKANPDEKQKVKKASKMDTLIDRLLAKGCRRQDIAILVRTYSASGSAQFTLLERAIPFRLEGGDKASVLDNPYVVNMLSWLALAAGRIAHRPFAGEPDNGSIFGLRPLLEVPRTGLDFESGKLLCAYVLKDPEDGRGFSSFINDHLGNTNWEQKIADRLRLIRSTWVQLRALASRKKRVDAYALIVQLWNHLQMEEVIERSSGSEADALETIELLHAFMVYAESHGKGASLNDFLDHIDNLRSFSDRAKAETDALHMTSLHRSKGLEWDYVIMPGLAQGRFPLMNKHITEEKWPAHLEDERRLFYVGMTRARKELHLIAPFDKKLVERSTTGLTGSPDNLEFSDNVASQFLYEANLYLSSNMPGVLRGTKKISEVGSPEVFNQYLEQVGSEVRVAKLVPKKSGATRQ